MRTKLSLLVSLFALAGLLGTSLPMQGAEKEKNVEVKCPTRIDQGAWDRLLKKYVNERGLVNYTAWKRNIEDMTALDAYLKEFAAKPGQTAEGNEKAAS